MTAKPLIRVLCVDDHPVVRSGLAAMLSADSEFAPPALAGNGDEAVALLSQQRPDAVVMDLHLRDEDGIDLARRLLQHGPALPIVMMTSYGGDEHVYRALDAGVRGYLFKDSLHLELLQALRAVLAGRRHIQADVARQLAENGPRILLTARETEVLKELARGLRNKQIGYELGVSESTARTHVENLLAKFSCSDRTAVVALAARRGFIWLG
jgi:DNA-binding NarL/FixJ family response regulator